MAGHRSASTETAPASVNYVRANTRAASRSKPQPTPRPQPATTQVPIEKQSKRSKLRSTAKKALTSVKKSLKTVSAICFPRDLHSATSSVGSRDSFQAQVRVSLISRTSTPSICLTRPTYRGSILRLSLHQVAPSRETSQPTCLDDVEGSQSGDGQTNRKSTRFQHPAVSRVIANRSGLDEIPPPATGESSLNATNTRPATASTVGTIDFMGQVNPKQIFKKSLTVRNTGNFETYKNAMDGVRTKSPRRAVSEAQSSVPATAPLLPYIAMAPAMAMNVSASTPQPEFASQSTELEVQATSSNVPAILVIPNILAPGVERPPAKPRVRPQTTNDGANYLPYIPYNPRFDPYSATPTASSSPIPIPAAQKKASAEDLEAAFAEAEAAEQAAIHKRHTTLYAAVESGSLTSLIATTSLLPTTSTAAAATAAATTNAAKPFTIKRKPVPKRPEVLKPSTSKPLPALPAPSSPRRFTYGVVQAARLQSDRDMLPSQKKWLSPAPKIARWRRPN